jgi:hypothetical protein
MGRLCLDLISWQFGRSWARGPPDGLANRAWVSRERGPKVQIGPAGRSFVIDS